MDQITTQLLWLLGGSLIGVACCWFGYRLSNPKNRTNYPNSIHYGNSDLNALVSGLIDPVLHVSASGQIMHANQACYELGIISADHRIDSRLFELAKQLSQGQTETNWLNPQQPQLALTLKSVALPNGGYVLLIQDHTRERQVESIRRDFVTNLSHELKTPIGAIRLLAETLTAAKTDPVAVENFSRRLTSESERLAQLVQQIIGLSKAQEFDAGSINETVDLVETVHTAIAQLTADAEAKSVSILTDMPKALITMGNPEQLQVAIANLVSNAIRYSNPNTAISISGRANQEQIQIRVSDQGIGIKSEDINRIFERFYRSDPARQRSTGGSGLGLAIVKNIASSHGGDVRVWSLEGEGSTFTLTLPVREINE